MVESELAGEALRRRCPSPPQFLPDVDSDLGCVPV